MNKDEGFQNWYGILWAIGASLFASFVTISVRGASSELSSALIVFHRFLFAAGLLAALILLHQGSRKSLRFSDPKSHLIRGVLIGLSNMFGFYALAHADLTAVTILFGLAPIFTTLISVLFLGQSIGIRRGLAMVAGLIGAVVIVNPSIQLELGMLAALVASGTFGIALAMSKGLSQKDGVLSTLVSSTILTLIVALPFTAQHFSWPSGTEAWFWITLLVLAGLGRQFADIEAYRFAEAAVIAPMFYLRLIFIPIGAYLLFSEIPKSSTWVGGAIVIAATLYITYRERALSKQN